MRIEVITTCVNYSDFLEHSLKENLNHVDGITIVTTHEDKATQGVCQKYGVACVQTDVFTEWGDKLNKGRAINLGIAHLRNDDWILHLDADIVLPHKFRSTLGMHPLDKTKIYGADRLNTKSYENWMQHKDAMIPQHENGCHVWAHPQVSLSSRLVHGQYGYVPIGYFQLWHSSQNKRYPVNQGSAEHTDMLFGLQWPKVKRQLLPELFVYHLESESAPQGVNWDGRKTKHFGPKHHHHHHHKPYCK